MERYVLYFINHNFSATVAFGFLVYCTRTSHFRGYVRYGTIACQKQDRKLTGGT